MYSNLTKDNNKIIQPDNLLTELMQHQKTAAWAMLNLEKNGIIDFEMRYYDNELKKLQLDTSIGILGDAVGSGKTLVVIALILNDISPPSRPVQYKSDMYVSIKLRDMEEQKEGCNLLMLPSPLVKQWIDAFDKFAPTIKYQRYIDNNDDKDKSDIEDLDVIIVSNANTKEFMKDYSGIKWKRIIIDEADTFKLRGKYTLKGDFIWLVTGTPKKIVYTKLAYLKDIFGKNKTWLPEYIAITNNKDFIEESMNLPVPERNVIKCYTPSELKYIKEYIPSTIINMINAGNTKSAIRALGCNVDTTDNIFKALTYKYEMIVVSKSEELKKLLPKWTKHKKKYNKEYNSVKRIVDRANERIKSIKKKIYEMKQDICPYCMGSFDKPTVVSCCGSVFCFECLTVMLNKNNKCPSCTKQINKNMINVLNKKKKGKNTKELIKTEDTRLDKIDVMANIITDNDNGKFLVFANYPATLKKIKNKLTELKISKNVLGGNGTKIHTTLQKFKEGKIQVLILNASNFGAGLNIQDATDVIIYHRFDKELEEQVIGRAQRYGREGILKIHYLIHDNETVDFMDSNKDTHDEDGEINMGLGDSDSDADSDSDTDGDSYTDSDSIDSDTESS